MQKFLQTIDVGDTNAGWVYLWQWTNRRFSGEVPEEITALLDNTSGEGYRLRESSPHLYLDFNGDVQSVVEVDDWIRIDGDNVSVLSNLSKQHFYLTEQDKADADAAQAAELARFAEQNDVSESEPAPEMAPDVNDPPATTPETPPE